MATKHGQEAIHSWQDLKNRKKVYKAIIVAVLVVFVIGMKIYYS